MKLNWIILPVIVMIFCLVTFSGLQAGRLGIGKKNDINCSVIPEDVVEDQSLLYNSPYETTDNVTLEPYPNVTNICIATYVGDNTTIITKRLSPINFTNTEVHLHLLNKSALTFQMVHVCDSECEERFNVGLIYVKENSVKDSKYFLQYYTNYRCLDPVSPIDSTTLEYYLTMVSIFFMCISVVSCVFYLVRFVMEESLRTLPGYCVLSLCIADLILYSCFFAMKIDPHNKNSKIICPVYLYMTLANWLWINVLTFDLWKTVRLAIVKIRRTTPKSLIIRFIYYSIYAWGVPLPITLLIVYPLFSDERLTFQGGFSHESKDLAELYIAIPLLIVQLSNFGLFYSSVYMIFQQSKSKSQSAQSEVSNIKMRFMFFFRLSFLQAVIWLLGLVGYIAKIEIFMYTYIYSKILEVPYIVWSYSASGRAKDRIKCSGFCGSTIDSETTST